MSRAEFNLLEESWIRVLDVDCAVQEVSLAEALLRAPEYADLAGEMPTQDVAVLRLLLAVLHAVFTRVDEEGREAPIQGEDDALGRWKALWRLGRFPEQPLRAYFARWRERFYLFHPERPFYQVPEAGIGTEYTAAKLNGEISKGNHKPRLFYAFSDIGAEKGRTELSYAQAARWLVHLNAYDDSSGKPKHVADEKASEGSGKTSKEKFLSPSVGWVGKIESIYAIGNNLFETLMMNFVLLRASGEPWGPPRPCWEREKPRSQQRTEIVWPDNQAELLTLQSRRLLLKQDNGVVKKYSLLSGDFFEPINAFCEQMAVWSLKRPAKRKNAPLQFSPKRVDLAQQIWREFPSLYIQQPEGQRPGIVDWLVRLQGKRILSSKRMIFFRTVAVEYGKSFSTIVDIYQDALSFHASLLEDLGGPWRRRIAAEIALCEQAAYAVGNLANDLAASAGSGGKNVSREARERFYFLLDQPFRQWLRDIDPEWDEDETEKSVIGWREQAQRLARALGERLVERAGDAAFVGRAGKSAPGGKKDAPPVYWAAPKAYNYFLYRIHDIYQGKASKGGT